MPWGNYFWQGVQPKVWDLYPYLRIFVPSKTTDLTFFLICANWDIFLQVFLPQKQLILPFFHNGPSFRDCFYQKGTHVKEFLVEKWPICVAHPHALTCEYPWADAFKIYIPTVEDLFKESILFTPTLHPLW